MPGTLPNTAASNQNRSLHHVVPHKLDGTYGSAIKRSVSFTILLGKAAMLADYYKRIFLSQGGIQRG